MNINQFREIIKEEVSAELKRALPKILNEYFKRDKNPTTNLKNVLSETEEISEEVPKREFKTYTKNPLLNQILNETTVKIPTSSDVSMGGSIRSETVGVDIKAVLPDVMNKDYSKLLKLVDKKANQHRH